MPPEKNKCFLMPPVKKKCFLVPPEKKKGFLIFDSQNAAAIGCKYKAGEAAIPRPQNMARQKLSDISNLPQNSRPLIQDQKSLLIPTTTKEYIDYLEKEILALKKMLVQTTEGSQIVEQRGAEIERLRLNLIKMREQNQHLALSHNRMLAEQNSGKGKLKVLQHALGCSRALLQAQKSRVKLRRVNSSQVSGQRDREKGWKNECEWTSPSARDREKGWKAGDRDCTSPLSVFFMRAWISTSSMADSARS